MDETTVDIYERRASEWLERRGSEPRDNLGGWFRIAAGDGIVADLGCGAGRYLTQIGPPVVGLDATSAMLKLASVHGAPLLRGDLESLPFADGSLHGVFARHSYLHLPKERIGHAFAEARRVLLPGGALTMTLIEGTTSGRSLPSDDFAGRYFALWTATKLAEALKSAGFADVSVERIERPRNDWDLLATARRPA